MRITATHKTSAKTIEILGVSEILERDGIYYISGKYNPKCAESEPLTIMYGGSILFRAKNVELADVAYYAIELAK